MDLLKCATVAALASVGISACSPDFGLPDRRFVCDPNADACGDGYVCQVDGFCRELNALPVYLSDLGYVINPGSDPVVCLDCKHDLGPLILRGVHYLKGIGVVTPSDLTFSLRKQFVRFVTDVGINDGTQNGAGAAAFQIWGDGRPLASTGTLTPTSATVTLDVDVSGMRELRLVVDMADGTTYYDWADWADARLFSQ